MGIILEEFADPFGDHLGLILGFLRHDLDKLGFISGLFIDSLEIILGLIGQHLGLFRNQLGMILR